MAKIRVGQTKRLQVLGSATSSSSGKYTIRSSVVLSKGIHNLEVLARSSVAVGAFSFPRKVIGRAGALVAVDSSAATGPVTVNIRMRALPRSEVPAVPDPGICLAIIKKTRELGKRLVKVAGLYSTEFPASMKLNYSSGSTTTVGVGVGIEGENGSFEAGGTFTETNSSKVLFPGESDETGRDMQTQYTWGIYRLSCGLMPQVTPERLAGGDNEPHGWIPATAGTNCTHYNPGGGLNRTTGTAGTFSAGVDLKKVIGINLSAQSGYTKQVAITYKFPQGGYLCGTDDIPTFAKWDVMDPSPGNVGQPG